MNRKSVYSLVLAVALAVSFVFPVFADDLATASDAVQPDADYYTDQLLMQPMALAASDLDLTQVNQYVDSTGKYITMGTNPSVPATAQRYLKYVTLNSGTPNGMEVQIMGLKLSDVKSLILEEYQSNGTWSSKTISDFSKYYVKLPNDLAYSFYFPIHAIAGSRYVFNFELKSGHSAFSVTTFVYTGNVYEELNGLYVGDTSTHPKLYYQYVGNNSKVPYGGIYMGHLPNAWIFVQMPTLSNVWFYKGYEYSIVFNVPYVLNGIDLYDQSTFLGTFPNLWGASLSSYAGKAILTFTPPYDLLASDMRFALLCKSTGSDPYFSQNIGVYSVSSSYIPKSDSGSQGQTTAANTTIIKNVVTNISNTVSNISNQITTSTTTIMNTITNTITNLQNSISSGLTNLGNSITGNADKNADKITQNNDQNTNKITQNNDKNTDKVTQNNDKNTDKITQNNDKNMDSLKNDWDSSKMDSTSESLSSTFDEYQNVEDSLTDTVNSALADFDFGTPESGMAVGVLSSVMFVGNYMQSVFESMGAFNFPIILSLTLVICLMLIGYARYKA